MTDNFIRHEILVNIFRYKQMFEFKKDMFISIENMHEYFPKHKKFDKAIVNLLSRRYVTIKKDNGVPKINIEEPGIFALSTETLKKEQYTIWWTYIKDGGTLAITILMAAIAIIALRKDESKFVEKEEIKHIQQEIIELKTQSSELKSLMHTYQDEIKILNKSSLLKDTITKLK